MNIKVKLFDERCKLQRNYKTDSGLDLRVRSELPITLPPFKPVFLKTGVAVQLPPGYEGQVRARSSMTRRGILTILGTVDNGYRGEIGVVLINCTQAEQTLNAYERIAQLVVSPVCIPNVQYCQKLDTTERGGCGFGSTGRV